MTQKFFVKKKKKVKFTVDILLNQAIKEDWRSEMNEMRAEMK